MICNKCRIYQIIIFYQGVLNYIGTFFTKIACIFTI